MLVSDLVDDESLDFLWGVALANGTARIPLLAPPIDASDHALEVYASGSKEPLVLIATPEGLPDEQGFPLRLRPATGSTARTSPKRTTNPKPTGDLRARRVTAPTLTKRHSRDLLGDAKPETSSPQALVGRAISGGKLVIESLLGSGGMGAVYKARHAGLNMPVAVKVLHESFQHDVDFCKRFHAEALAASQLVHPNLTRVHDFGQEPDGLLYIAMEFLEGRSLRSILESDGRLGVERAVKLMLQVCAGLLHVHARALVHRDIKPDNLLVLPGMDDDGEPIEQVKVCDFGIAVGGSQANAKLAGTPDYMSPEQCRGEAVDARSDVYACGASLYELVTGRPPFEEDDTMKLLRAHMEKVPEPPSTRAPGIPPALDELVMKALAKDPADRQESARELRRELKAVLEAPRRTSSPPSSRHIPAAAPVAPPAPVSFRNADDTRDYASTLARDPEALVAKMRAATNEFKFAETVAALDGAVPRLMERGEVAALLALAEALEEIAKERTSRAAVAASALKPFADPQLLAPIAEGALGGPDVVAAGCGRVITRAGTGGAYALFTARVKSRSPTARSRFRSLLPSLGVAALPVIRSALERIMAKPEAFGAMEIATDLLLSLPSADDEALGNIVARYARAADETVAAAATWALPRLWGMRAQALLVALLHHPGESARIAAASALQQLDAVDEFVVRKLAAVALDPTPKSPPSVRIAAIHALVGARADAKNAAAEILAHAMEQWPESAELVDLTECLFTLCGPNAATIARKRAATCRTKVRDEIERVIAEHAAP
ncbi:MAG: serine/threonine protein kinase [Deltaproteobacteria bacterium]|nr:serine/threonine protein kinase [Deltaproteobacteria bacterium]